MSEVFTPTCKEFTETFSRDNLYDVMAGAVANFEDEYVQPGDFTLITKFQVKRKAYLQVADLLFIYCNGEDFLIPKVEFHSKVFEVLRRHKAIL